MNLLLTPGVFDVAQTIQVQRSDTIVLGMGLATLTAVNGAVVMEVTNAQGVDLAGITIDAGTKNSPVLLRIGEFLVAGATRRTRLLCRTSSSGSEDRTSARRPSASRSTATT